MISKDQLLSLLKILNDGSHTILESFRSFEIILQNCQENDHESKNVPSNLWALLLNLLHSSLLNPTQECVATTLALIQYASLQATATYPIPSNLPTNEVSILQALKSRQLYQSNMILRFLLYRVYIVYESSYNTENITKSSSVSPSISASQLFLVHLLKAYYAAEMNATVLIKELLAMTAHDIITKLTVGRAIEKSTTYTLLCAYQARYPLLLPTPPLPLLDTNTAVSNPSIRTSVSSSSSSSNSRQIYSAIMRQIPDIMFESRVGVINSAIVADDAMDKLLVLLNRYGDSYFQYGMIGTWIWKSVGTQEKLSCLLRVYESYQESCIKSSNINTNINTISNNNSSSVINRGSSEETASVGDMVNSVVNSVTTTSSTLSSSSSLLSTVVAESSDNVTSTNIPTSSIQTQTEPNIQSNIQSNSQANIESIKSDFETAHVSALTPAATQRLVEGLRECFSDLTGLSKQCLPYFSGLVEHNPSVAAEWLIILATQSDDPYHRVNSENSAVTSIGSTDVTAVGEGPVGQHLVLLMMMEKNLKSIEVVNRLCSCSTISLPTVFLQSYITGCIESCSFISDVYLQTRRVRLICAFFMSLIRSPSTSTVRAMKSYNVEIQTFCIEFARVKEASTLYRMLKLPPSATESL